MFFSSAPCCLLVLLLLLLSSTSRHAVCPSAPFVTQILCRQSFVSNGLGHHLSFQGLKAMTQQQSATSYTLASLRAHGLTSKLQEVALCSKVIFNRYLPAAMEVPECDDSGFAFNTRQYLHELSPRNAIRKEHGIDGRGNQDGAGRLKQVASVGANVPKLMPPQAYARHLEMQDGLFSIEVPGVCLCRLESPDLETIPPRRPSLLELGRV